MFYALLAEVKLLPLYLSIYLDRDTRPEYVITQPIVEEYQRKKHIMRDHLTDWNYLNRIGKINWKTYAVLSKTPRQSDAFSDKM
jgi:hypothetical protein